MANNEGRTAVLPGGLDARKVSKAFSMVCQTQDLMAPEELALVEKFAHRILNDPEFVKMSGTARFIALFNVIQWGVETIEKVVDEGRSIKPN